MISARWTWALVFAGLGCAGPPPAVAPEMNRSRTESTQVHRAQGETNTIQPSMPPPATPEAWCELIRADNQRFLGATDEAMPECHVRNFLPEHEPLCRVYGKPGGPTQGAFALALSRPEAPPGDSEPCGRGVVELRLMHLNRGESMVDTGWRTLLNVTDYWGSVRLTTFTTSDLNGDLTPEVYVETGMHEEGYDEDEAFLLRLQGDKVVPYPTDPYPVAYARDVDGDGRLDLLTPWRYSAIRYQTPLADASMVPEDMFVARAQQDGTFRLDDDVALRRLRGKCSSSKGLAAACQDAAGDFAQLGEAVVCARYLGATFKSVKRQLDGCCRSYVDYAMREGECPRQLLDVAAIAIRGAL